MPDGVPEEPLVICVVGKTKAGKTALIERLVPALVRRGLRVATIKHDVHGFEMDREGKDSYRHKHAGAAATVISSPHQIGMVRDVDHDHVIADLVAGYLDDMDVVLTEGYARERWPKVEVHRRALARPLITTPERGLVAVVSDEQTDAPLPHFGFGPDDTDRLAAFLVDNAQSE